MFTIQDLKEGKCAVLNDGTLEELREVMALAFDAEKNNGIEGINKYYYQRYTSSIGWYSSDVTGLPFQSAKDFLIPKRGDRVLVSHKNRPTWTEATFLTYVEGAKYPYITLYEYSDINKPPFLMNSWEFMKKIPPIKEVSMQEIADKFGIPVEQLKIKK